MNTTRLTLHGDIHETSERVRTHKISPVEIVGVCLERIEELNAWLALYNIEAIPRYQALLLAIVDTLRGSVEREQPGIFMVNGFVM